MPQVAPGDLRLKRKKKEDISTQSRSEARSRRRASASSAPALEPSVPLPFLRKERGAPSPQSLGWTNVPPPGLPERVPLRNGTYPYSPPLLRTFMLITL